MRLGPCLLAFVVLAPMQARGLTTPASGAAARPAGLTLAAPFPCGVAYRVTGGYGANLHININEPLKANDYHALDLVRDESGNGHDKPLTAAAAGTVKYAGWASGGWSTYGQIVFIELDFNDGHSYQLLYAHLEKVLVSQGQHVNARDTVGHLGGSGNNSLTYWSSHLHFVFYRDAKLQLSPTVGPYGGVAAVPEPMDSVEDFVVGTKATVTCPPPPPDQGPAPSDTAPPHDLGAALDATGVDAGDGPISGKRDGLPPLATDSGTLSNRPSDGGCACRAGGAPSGLPALAFLLLLLAWLRSR